MGTKIYTVSELNREIKLILERTYPCIWIEGEISNFRIAPSGHSYFTLKDEKSQIQAVMLRAQQRSLRFQPEDGMYVVCQGRLGVYEPRGTYQIYVEAIELRGIGALQFAFEKLKKKLATEGLFDSERKKPLPILPQRIAIITSPRGAAIRDVLRIFSRCSLAVESYILPVKVQGEGAAEEMGHAIEKANQLSHQYRFDVIVLCRGGGSLEDLWEFNKETLARSIHRSEIPVISAVGHEIDFTIADFVADLRAPTPTGAAEMIVTQLEKSRTFFVDIYRRIRLQIHNLIKFKQQYFATLAKSLTDPRRLLANWRLALDDHQNKIIRAYSNSLSGMRSQLVQLEGKIHIQHPGNVISEARQRCAHYQRELKIFIRQHLSGQREKIDKTLAKLDILNPIEVLKRGYSVTYLKPHREIVTSGGQVRKGDYVDILLSKGSLECLVESSKEEQTEKLTRAKKHREN